MRSLFAELAGVVLIAAGSYLAVGIAGALIVTGVLVLIGAQMYGLPATGHSIRDDEVAATEIQR